MQEVDTLYDSDTASDRTSDRTDINNKQNDPPQAMMADVINAFLYNDCGCPNVSSLQEVDTLDDSDTAADRTSDTTDINNKQNDPPQAMMADLLTDKDLFDSID